MPKSGEFVENTKPNKVHIVDLPSPEKTSIRRSKRKDRNFIDGVSLDRKGLYLNRRDVDPQNLTRSKWVVIDGVGKSDIDRVYVEEHFVVVRLLDPLPEDLPRYLDFMLSPP